MDGEGDLRSAAAAGSGDPRRALVFGCGYLGSRVAELWLKQGREVFATTRNPETADVFRSKGLVPVVCDVLDQSTLGSLPSVDTVVYCVGLDRTAGASMRDVYVRGLRNVLDNLPRPRRFIHVSSTSVYRQTTGEWVDETAETKPQEESGRIVLEAEQLLRDRLPDAVIMRFAGIYGPDRLMRRQAVVAGEPVGGESERWLNLIHVDDGAAAVLAAERHARPGATYNICDDHPVLRGEFYAEMARFLGAPAPRFSPSTTGAHESTHRRISNRRLHEELKLELRYPSYKEGLPAAL